MSKSEAVDHIIKAQFKTSEERRRRISTLTRPRRANVVVELTLSETVGIANTLLFKKALPIIRKCTRAPVGGPALFACFGKRKFLRLAFFKNTTTKPFANFIFWTNKHVN